MGELSIKVTDKNGKLKCKYENIRTNEERIKDSYQEFDEEGKVKKEKKDEEEK